MMIPSQKEYDDKAVVSDRIQFSTNHTQVSFLPFFYFICPTLLYRDKYLQEMAQIALK